MQIVHFLCFSLQYKVKFKQCPDTWPSGKKINLRQILLNRKVTGVSVAFCFKMAFSLESVADNTNRKKSET